MVFFPLLRPFHWISYIQPIVPGQSWPLSTPPVDAKIKRCYNLFYSTFRWPRHYVMCNGDCLEGFLEVTQWFWMPIDGQIPRTLQLVVRKDLLVQTL